MRKVINIMCGLVFVGLILITSMYEQLNTVEASSVTTIVALSGQTMHSTPNRVSRTETINLSQYTYSTSNNVYGSMTALLVGGSVIWRSQDYAGNHYNGSLDSILQNYDGQTVTFQASASTGTINAYSRVTKRLLNNKPKIELLSLDNQVKSEIEGNNNLGLNGSVSDQDVGNSILIFYSIDNIPGHQNNVLP
ncbi:hypothetical protein ACFSCX_06250 [Bacillus salitolerans]|uniref:Uncharacterized protein n=1 Tax=Bacillus salitolerans TaxID=1437434 RepID=A0ABW4LN92_9BACI